MFRSRAGIAVMLGLAFIATTFAVAVAQEEAPESIYIANAKVITIRDKGVYASIRTRAIAIDKAVTEIISNQDTQNLKIDLKEVDGLWTISSGVVKIVAVHPAEAEANGLPARSLAAMWVKNLREAFPRATPCSKLPASAFQPKPGATSAATTPPPAPGTGPVPAIPTAVIVSAGSSAGAVVRTPAPAPTPSPVATVVGAPELLVRDAFNTVRALSEEEFVAKREELLHHLIRDLTPFITGKVASSVPGTRSVTPAVPVTPVPPTVTTPGPVSPVAPTPITPAPVPTVTPPTTYPVPVPTGSAPAAETLAPEKSGDAAYAKVPQKNRIRKKLEATRQPYLALRAQDPAAAKPISDMLASCRSAFARGGFDEAERYVDSALMLLGVRFTE